MIEKINLNVGLYLDYLRKYPNCGRFIGFGGKLGAGKTYLANALVSYINSEMNEEVAVRYAFGDTLRDFVANNINIPIHSYKHNTTPVDESTRTLCKNLLIEHLDEYEFDYDLNFITKQFDDCEILNHVYRFVLQYVGTEVYRMQERSSFWVDEFDAHIDNNFSNKDIIVCDDVRFGNEIALINDSGFSVYVISMNSNEMLDQKKSFVVNHASESSLYADDFNLVYFNVTDIAMDVNIRGKHLFNSIFPHILLYNMQRCDIDVDTEEIFKMSIISIDK